MNNANRVFDLETVLCNLAEERHFFHSEADFQFALAQAIQNEYRGAEIRLERPVPKSTTSGRESGGDKLTGSRYIDLLVYWNKSWIPIELKYKTAEFESVADRDGWKEQYVLKNHSALDTGRYDCIKDILRIETVLKQLSSSMGFVVWLTNASSYWNEETKRAKSLEEIESGSSIEEVAQANDIWLSIHEGRVLEGKLGWVEFKEKTYGASRKGSIKLKGNYKIHWETWWRPDKTVDGSESSDSEFKYALFKVLPCL